MRHVERRVTERVLLILTSLAREPRHGYALIKDIEQPNPNASFHYIGQELLRAASYELNQPVARNPSHLLVRSS